MSRFSSVDTKQVAIGDFQPSERGKVREGFDGMGWRLVRLYRCKWL